jgi:hypothetical protein
MPVGWASVGPGSGYSGPGCINAAGRLVAARATASANTAFEYDGYLPALVEALSEQPHGPAKIFARTVAVLVACKNLGVSSGSGPTTIGQMSFPSFGDQSEAFTASGEGVVADALVMRKGTQLMLLIEVNMVLGVSLVDHR